MTAPVRAGSPTAQDESAPPEPARRKGPRRGVLISIVIIVAITGIAGTAWATQQDRHPAPRRVEVPGLGVTVSGIPDGWTMRPSSWALTRLDDSRRVLTATATWWPESGFDDSHNTFEVCVERVDQRGCPTTGDSVVGTDLVGDDKRMSVSVLERNPSITNEQDEQAWQQVTVK